MRAIGFCICVAILAFSTIMPFLCGLRLFSAAVTPSPTVTRPTEGMVCAHIITTDGAAISCIPDALERAE